MKLALGPLVQALLAVFQERVEALAARVALGVHVLLRSRDGGWAERGGAAQIHRLVGIVQPVAQADTHHELAERLEVQPVALVEADDEPFGQHGLAALIGQHALKNEAAVTGLEALVRQHDGRLVTAKVRRHAVVQPLGDGVLFPKQLVFGPGIGALPALLERFLNQRSIRGELEHPVGILLELGRQEPVTLAQVGWRLQGEARDLRLPVGRLQLGGLGEIGWLAIQQLLKGFLSELEVAFEQAQRLSRGLDRGRVGSEPGAAREAIGGGCLFAAAGLTPQAHERAQEVHPRVGVGDDGLG